MLLKAAGTARISDSVLGVLRRPVQPAHLQLRLEVGLRRLRRLRLCSRASQMDRLQVILKLNLLENSLEVYPEVRRLLVALRTVAVFNSGILPLLKGPLVMLALRLFLPQVLQVRRVALREFSPLVRSPDLVLDSLEEEQLQHLVLGREFQGGVFVGQSLLARLEQVLVPDQRLGGFHEGHQQRSEEEDGVLFGEENLIALPDLKEEL